MFAIFFFFKFFCKEKTTQTDLGSIYQGAIPEAYRGYIINYKILMKLASFDDKTLQGILAEIKKAPKAEDNVCGYGGYWSLDGGWLPGEVVCTPHGNHVNYGGYIWSDYSAGFVDGVGVYNGSWCGEEHPQGGGGGDCGSTQDTPDYSDYDKASIVANAIIDSIDNNTAIFFQQVQNTSTFKFANATCIADATAISYYDLVRQIMEKSGGALSAMDKNFIKAMKGIGSANAVANTIVALIGVADGEVTTADAWAGAGAMLGLVGLACPPVSAIALTVGGLSLICTFVSGYYQYGTNNEVIFSY